MLSTFKLYMRSMTNIEHTFRLFVQSHGPVDEKSSHRVAATRALCHTGYNKILLIFDVWIVALNTKPRLCSGTLQQWIRQ